MMMKLIAIHDLVLIFSYLVFIIIHFIRLQRIHVLFIRINSLIRINPLFYL